MAEIEVEFDNKEVEKFLKNLVKNTKEVDRSSVLEKNIAPVIFRDILEHFNAEMGPKTKWPALTGWYAKWKKKKFGDRPMLVMSGDMRKAFLPANSRITNRGYEFYNTMPYSGEHDRGENGKKKREFMFLTDEGMNRVSALTMAFIMKD